MPENGFADRSTDALRNLTAEKLAAFGDTSVDIAAGLGEEVVVLGISAGGTVAAWAAQNRPEVDRAVLVAPFFGLAGFGPRVNVGLMRAMLVLPHISVWKDPVLRERYGGMPHAYQRQSTRATGEIIRLALAVYRQAVEGPAAAGEIAVITNEADSAVSNIVTRFVVDQWVRQGSEVTMYEFPAEKALGHELIDPLEPGADPDLTYPLILEMIDDPSAVSGAFRF
jgi:pimeloyl-ACP methyl ester carboxylesterase